MMKRMEHAARIGDRVRELVSMRPEWYYADGGDVVKIKDSKTAWIRSDTYVNAREEL